MGKASGWLLLVLFAVVLGVSAVTLFFAFANHRLAVEMTHRTLADMADGAKRGSFDDQPQENPKPAPTNPKSGSPAPEEPPPNPLTKEENPASPDGKLAPLSHKELCELWEKSHSGLRADDMSFLFTVFSILIISASVYALHEVWKMLRKVGQYATLGEENATAMTIACDLCACHDMAVSIAATNGETAWNLCVPVLREHMKSLRKSVEQAQAKECAMPAPQRESFHDIARRTLDRLRYPKDEQFKDTIEDCIEDCKEVVKILGDNKFEKRFEERRKCMEVQGWLPP